MLQCRVTPSPRCGIHPSVDLWVCGGVLVVVVIVLALLQPCYYSYYYYYYYYYYYNIIIIIIIISTTTPAAAAAVYRNGLGISRVGGPWTRDTESHIVSVSHNAYIHMHSLEHNHLQASNIGPFVFEEPIHHKEGHTKGHPLQKILTNLWVVLAKNSLHSFPAVMPANQILVSQKGKTLWCLHLVVTQYHWEDAIHLICLCLTCCTCFLPFNLCKKHILYHQQVMFSVCYFVSRAGTLGFMTAAGTLPKTRGPSRPCHAVSTHQQITAV